jgi:hypothetical protein
LKTPLRVIGWKLRRYLTRHLAPGPISWAMAAHYSGVAGASFVFCCKRPMVAVAYSDSDHGTDLISLGCTLCGSSVPVRVGILDDGCEEHATVH